MEHFAIAMLPHPSHDSVSPYSEFHREALHKVKYFGQFARHFNHELEIGLFYSLCETQPFLVKIGNCLQSNSELATCDSFLQIGLNVVFYNEYKLHVNFLNQRRDPAEPQLSITNYYHQLLYSYLY